MTSTITTSKISAPKAPEIKLSTPETVTPQKNRNSQNRKPWYFPTASPEHGVLLVLAGALLTGASLAQAWTWETTLACLGAFLGLQAEHPLIVQIKQRRQWKPRYLFWAGLYGGSATLIAGWLSFQHPCLIWVCGGAFIAMGLDVIAVIKHRQKSIGNEIVMFSAICLATLFTYGTTSDILTLEALGLWCLNTLFFASAVYTIKLRKSKTSSLKGGLVYHGIASIITILLFFQGWLSLWTALAFTIALLKFATIIWQHDWYCNCRFEYIARFETYFALTYTALVCLTLLPPYLEV